MGERQSNIDASLKLVRATRALLGPKGEHWIRGRLAADAGGISVSALAPNAASFCLVGAICSAMGRVDSTAWTTDTASAALKLSAARHGFDIAAVGALASFNDYEARSFDDVAMVLDSAIDMLEECSERGCEFADLQG